VKQALRQLLGDFLSAILFLVVYALSGDLVTAIAVAAGIAQLARIWQTGRRVEPMQVVVLGGATMLTQSPRFIMVKPTIVHFAVAAVMLQLDAPLSAGNRCAERTGAGDRGGGLRVGRPARGDRAGKPDHRPALRFRDVGLVRLRWRGRRQAGCVRAAVWRFPNSHPLAHRVVGGLTQSIRRASLRMVFSVTA